MTDWPSPGRAPAVVGVRTGGRVPTRSRTRTAAGRLDRILLGAVLALIALGSLLVWSATRQRMLDAGLEPETLLRRHLFTAAVGIALGAVAATVDYRVLRAYAPLVYLAAVAGLIAVLSPLGSTINGAHSWIVLAGGWQVQPAEFAKVALVVGMAMLLAEPRDDQRRPGGRDVLLVLALAAVPVGLILLQPDFGTTMVFVFLVLGVIAVAGVRIRWLVGLVLCGVLLGGAAAQLGVLEDYQLARLTAFANPDIDPTGTGYNAQQARIAIGSGGVFGKGLFEGSQTRGSFIPEQHTDFIFTVAGEELGLVGAGAVLALLGLVLWRGLRIAAGADDAFGALVAAGVVAWFTFQSFVNIGMTLGIMPVTGLPLPFVSYGGSAMFANCLAVGLLLAVHGRSARAGPRF